MINIFVNQEVERGRPEAQGLGDLADDTDNAAVVQAQRKKRPKKAQVVLNVEGTQNEELRALEAHMLKLSKLGKSLFQTCCFLSMVSLLYQYNDLLHLLFFLTYQRHS